MLFVNDAHSRLALWPGPTITDGPHTGSTLTGMPFTIVTPLTMVDVCVGLADGNAEAEVVGAADGATVGVAVGVTDGRGATVVRMGVAVTVARFV